MKKLILFLLPLFALAQNNPFKPPYGIQNTVATENSTPTYFVTQETDGVHKKTPAANIALKTDLDLKQTVFTGICQKQFLTENDFTIDNSALTLTISTVKNGTAISSLNPVRFFTDGSGIAVMHEKTSPVTFNFTNTTGIWYFYFDSSGNPIATQTPWTEFSTIATVYRFYWNATLGVADRRVIEAVEFHKNDVSWVDHAWKHLEGAKWSSGLTISSNAISAGTPTVDGSNAVITLSSGTILDDNIYYTLTNAATGSVKFTQNLGTGLLPATSGKFICISNSASGLLEKIPATDFPFLWNSGTNTPEYLTVNGTRTSVTANNYFVYYVYALQDPRYGETIKIKSAETDFANLTLAQAHNWEQLQTLFPTLRDGEIRLLYKLTFEYKTSYDVGTKKSVLRYVDDLRKQKTTTTAVASGTVPATNVSVSPVGGISSTNAQSALQEVDAEAEKIANKSDSYTISSSTTYTSTKALVDGLTTKVASNVAITGATNTKITYDSKGLVTAGTSLIAGDIPNIAEAQVTNLTSDLASKANLASPNFTGTVSGISKAMVGLGNADNTTDLNKPISTSTQAALNLKANQSSTYTKSEVDSKIANLNEAYHVDFIDSGSHTFTVPSGIIIQNVYLNNIPVYGADWSQTTTTVSVTTSVTGDKVTLTGGNFVLNDFSVYAQKNEVAKTNIEKLGLLNAADFFISTDAYKVAKSILDIEIEVDDSVATAADIRIYGVFCQSSNPTVTVVMKNYTTSELLILERTSGVNSGIITLQGVGNADKLKAKILIDLDILDYSSNFNFYQDNTTASAKFSFTKFSEVLQSKTQVDVKIDDINTELGFIENDLIAIKNAALGFDNTLVYTNESVNGYYGNYDGTFFTSAGHHSRKYTIGLNRDIYATGTVAGSGIALANYYDVSGVFISSEFTAVNHEPRVYTRQKLTVPNNCVYIGISTVIDTPYGVMEQGIVDIVTSEELALYNNSDKIGKKMAWFGTSIPETGYPSLIATKLGCTIYNEAVGSSCIRAFSSVSGTQKDLYWEPALRALSHTIAEKQSMIDHWSTGLNSSGVITGGGTFGWRDLLLGSPPAVLSSYASDTTILGWSYEKKLVAKYLDTTSPDFIAMPDYFILDHGHNDLVVYEYDGSDSDAINIPSVRNDRKYFNGAMNYIIDVILSYNPRANIVFIGHYENDRKVRIYQAQEKIAEYWDFPFLKLWEKMGFTQQLVSTTGYWSDAYTWNNSGGSLTNKTLTQIWMQDDLHPVSTPAKEKFAKIVGDFINKN